MSKMMKQRLRIISSPRIRIKREAIEICLERSDIAVTSYRCSKALNKSIEDYGTIVKSDYAPYKRSTPMYMVDFPEAPTVDLVDPIDTSAKAADDESKVSYTKKGKPTLPFICPVCDMSFHFKSRLRAHVSTRHLNLKNFVCNVCDRRFKLKHHLKYHAKTHDHKRKPHKQRDLHHLKGEQSDDELDDFYMQKIKTEIEDIVIINDDDCYDYEFLTDNEEKVVIERCNPSTSITIKPLKSSDM